MELENSSRDRILRTAGQLFAQHGFRATTLRQISSTSGANGALVSYYFGSKDGLRDALMAEQFQNLEQTLQSFDTGSELKQVVREIFRHVRKEKEFYGLALRAGLEDAETQNKVQAGVWEPIYLFLQARLQETGSAQPAAGALALCGMVQQYAYLLCFPKKLPLPLEKYEDYVAGSLAPSMSKA